VTPHFKDEAGLTTNDLLKPTDGYQNPLRRRFSDAFFRSIPNQSGIYLFLNARMEPLYIGKAENLRRRLTSYRRLNQSTGSTHILEMIELAQMIVWEVHAETSVVRAREKELIRALRPPFNISDRRRTKGVYYSLFLHPEELPNGNLLIDVRYSYALKQKDQESFGCYLDPRLAREALAALLRFISLSRLYPRLPEKLTSITPLHVYRLALAKERLPLLRAFLYGQDPALRQVFAKELMEREDLAPELYPQMQKDLRTLTLFFEELAQPANQVRRLLGRPEQDVMKQDELEDIIRKRRLKLVENLGAAELDAEDFT
jgi:excinuclease ABC subunit C